MRSLPFAGYFRIGVQNAIKKNKQIRSWPGTVKVHPTHEGARTGGGKKRGYEGTGTGDGMWSGGGNAHSTWCNMITGRGRSSGETTRVRAAAQCEIQGARQTKTDIGAKVAERRRTEQAIWGEEGVGHV